MLSLLPPARPESSDWFALSADVGRNRPNRRDDTFRVESLLANDGDAELRGGDGPAGRWNFGLDGAIRRFQKRNGLKVDGWLRPGGPTIEALRARQGDAFAGFDVPAPDEIDAHHAAIADGSEPLIAFASPQATLAPIPDLPKLGQADRDSNTSQLDWLDAHQVGLGEIPAQFARYVELGPQGIAQARDFVQQFQRRWPGERDALVDGILDRLDQDGQSAFLGAPRPKGQPFGTRIGGMRKPAEPVARDLLLRKDEELPDHLTRRTLEFRKGEDEGGATPMTAANDTDDGDTGGDAANDPQAAPAEPQSKPRPPELASPVPDFQVREQDEFGEGKFEAGRGKGKTHKGIDLVAPPGASVVSPVDGTVVSNKVDPYGKDPKKSGVFSGVRIKTDDGHLIDVLYVKQGEKPIPEGMRIKSGDQIGTAQDLSVMYKPTRAGGMTNHVHVQIQKGGVFIDPTPLFRQRK